MLGKLSEVGTSALQIQVADSIAVFFTDPGGQPVLEGVLYTSLRVLKWLSVSNVDLQLTKLSYNAAIVERSGVAGKLVQVSQKNTLIQRSMICMCI